MLSSITSRFVPCGEAAIHCGRRLWRVRVEILSLVLDVLSVSCLQDVKVSMLSRQCG